MLNIKRRIFAGAYIICVFNFATVIFYNFELLDAKGVMDLFVSIYKDPAFKRCD